MPRRAARRNPKRDGLNAEQAARVIRERTGLPCSRQSLERAAVDHRLPRACDGIRPLNFIPEYLLADYWRWKGDPAQADRHEPESMAAPTPPDELEEVLGRQWFEDPPPKVRKPPGRPRLPRDENGKPIRKPTLKPLEESEGKIAKKLLNAVLDHHEVQRKVPLPASTPPLPVNDGIIKLPQGTTELPAGLLLSDGTINSAQAKAWAELERARKLQVERLKAEGEVIARSEIEPAWARALVSINRSVMGIASRLKSDNADLPLDIIEQVERLCREALNAASAELQALEEG